MNTNSGGGSHDPLHASPPQQPGLSINVNPLTTLQRRHAHLQRRRAILQRLRGVAPQGDQHAWPPQPTNPPMQTRLVLFTGSITWLNQRVNVFYARVMVSRTPLDAMLVIGDIVENNTTRAAPLVYLTPAVDSGINATTPSLTTRAFLLDALPRWSISKLPNVPLATNTYQIAEFVVQAGGGNGQVVPFGNSPGVVRVQQWLAGVRALGLP